MKTPLLAALGLALIALASALYLFTGTKAQEPALGVAQTATPERSATTDDTSRESVNVEPAAAAEEVQRTNIATSSSEATAGSECVVRVVDAARQPLDAVRVFALDAAQQLQNAKTGADGRARFAASGAVQLFAIAPARPVQRFELELAAGERELMLDAPSVSVAGVLTVGGAPPSEPLRLHLESTLVPFGDLALPKDLRTALSQAARRQTPSDTRGVFEFVGLDADWSGKLRFLGGYVLARTDQHSSQQREIALERARTDLRFDLERLPRIVGRFELGGGEPVQTKAMVGVSVLAQQGRARSSSQASIDAQGRFSYVVNQIGVETVEVLLECELGRGARTAALNELPRTSEGDFDLGAIVLTPSSVVRVRALASGSPVAQTKARISGEQKWSDGDAEGRINVRTATSGPATLRVIATDYWAIELPVFLPRDDEVVVALEPANVLTIAVLDAAGVPAGGARVVFEVRGEPLFVESKSMRPDEAIIGVRKGAGSDSQESGGDMFEGRLAVIADAAGVVELQGLTSVGALSVRVDDALGQPLVSQAIEALGVAERRRLELRLPAALKSLHGRVLDPSGRPVANAEVHARIGDSRSVHGRTDASGRFELKSLSADEVNLKVESDRFAPRVLPRVAVLNATTEIEVMLEPGRTVVVELVDEAGTPQVLHTVFAKTPDGVHQWKAEARADGRCQFRPLPTGPLKVTAYTHSREYTRELGDHDELVRIVTPTPGQLTVRLASSVDVTQRPPVVQLRSLDGVASARAWFAKDTPRGPLSMGPLEPGEYELRRMYLGSTELGDSAGLHEVGAPLRVSVRAGETTEVELP